MRTFNVNSPSQYFSEDFGEVILTYYNDAGEVVEDIELAAKDQFGNPVYCSEHQRHSRIVNPIRVSTLPSYDHSDPVALQSARLARATFNTVQSLPTSYIEKFEAARYADNVSNALSDKLVDLSKSDE